MGCVGSLPRQFLLFNFLWLLVSSVSDFHLDTGRAVVDNLVHYSVALWGGRDAANKYYWRVLAVSHPLWACPCSRCTPLRLYIAPQGNGLRLALGFMHLPGLSRSGSALRKPTEAQIWLGLRFVPFPGPSGSGVGRAWSLRLWPLPVAQFPGSTAGVPSQEDDRPEPPEVLVSKEACLHFGR